MNADDLLALYEKVAEAPDAIARLRRFVLDLAVRGKLVAQDATDEPVSKLLMRIETEKARLIEAGEIRKPRVLANADDLESPFDIPSSWRWCRLDTVGAIIGGGTPSASNPENFTAPCEGVPWLTPADLGGFRDLLIERGARDLTEKGLSSSSATMMPAGTVLFTSRAPIGYVAIASNPISTNQGFKSIVPYVADCSRFIALAMQTFAPDINANAPGTTFKEVSGKIVAAVPFPLPPLTEQRRIVAKVEELMGLLDRLEAARERREETRDRLTTASLARLTAPETSTEDFPAHARFALGALPALTARPDQVKQVRESILNLAARGKLVAQEPTDEPASKALIRMMNEKKKAIKERAIRGAKIPVQPDPKKEGLDIPSTWELCALGQISLVTDPNPSHRYPDYSNGTVPILSTREFDGEDGWNPESAKLTTQAFWEFQKEFCAFSEGDIIFARKGRLGLPRFLPNLEKFTFSHTLFVIKPMSELVPEYLLLLLMRQEVVGWLTNEMNQNTGVPTLGKAKTERLPIPLPPLAEQHRIVERVDALMALCDRLEAALTTANTTRAKFLQALLHEALEQPDDVLEAAE